ncbi:MULTISPECIES: Rho-binding antiterminator [unclassified Shewanella]|uniref:Rho-binding antiterminator n=1 Tax=Shewanella TaxID=22 RepID=UPI000E847A52|nr:MULTISPECIES: Rho-binding antiterminator [unclassified Shewanella]MBW3532600.1 Rho-binding antiterminator [Shewanella sp. NKUCC06_TVS]MCU7986750.1 Rho-binding antiterminator [Shewanella sp. SW24]HAY93320.1 transcriptional antiterminator [Shewanella sp.]
MSDYKMIPCAHYDYLELACLRGYQLNIELIDGTQCQGQAITTQTRADKTEWLIIQLQQTKQSLRLDHIAAITPLEPNAEFGRVLIAAKQRI